LRVLILLILVLAKVSNNEQAKSNLCLVLLPALPPVAALSIQRFLQGFHKFSARFSHGFRRGSHFTYTTTKSKDARTSPPPPIFVRSVNPIPTRGRFFPPLLSTGISQFFHLPAPLTTSSYLPVQCQV
jgi:hypothetical protein